MQIIAAELLHHHHDATRTWRNAQLRRSLTRSKSALLSRCPLLNGAAIGRSESLDTTSGTDALEFSHRALAAVSPSSPAHCSLPSRSRDRQDSRIPFYAPQR